MREKKKAGNVFSLSLSLSRKDEDERTYSFCEEVSGENLASFSLLIIRLLLLKNCL